MCIRYAFRSRREQRASGGGEQEREGGVRAEKNHIINNHNIVAS
jgi:hypothetical protein